MVVKLGAMLVAAVFLLVFEIVLFERFQKKLVKQIEDLTCKVEFKMDYLEEKLDEIGKDFEVENE